MLTLIQDNSNPEQDSARFRTEETQSGVRSHPSLGVFWTARKRESPSIAIILDVFALAMYGVVGEIKPKEQKSKNKVAIAQALQSVECL